MAEDLQGGQGVAQGAVRLGGLDFQAGGDRRQAVRSEVEIAAGDIERVDHTQRLAGLPEARQLGFQKAQIKWGVMADQHGSVEQGQHLSGNFRERRRLADLLIAQTVDPGRARRDRSAAG